jgi:hypothetical protein
LLGSFSGLLVDTVIEEALMTITLDLPPETEEALLAQANAQGVTLSVFLETIICNQVAAAEAMKPLRPLPQQGEESDRLIDELFDAVDVPPGVGEGEMSRENWYR